jgi:hypothetical protein
MKVMILNEYGRHGHVCGSQMKVMFLNEKGRQGRLWKPNEGDAFE